MVLTARVVYRFAVAWLLYCGLEARLVFFLWLRSALRLRFALSPLGFRFLPVRLRIVFRPLGLLLCLLSRRLPSVLLFS